MNILIIEDDKNLWKRIHELFSEKTNTNIVTLITTYPEFLEKYHSLSIYDVVLTDLNLWSYSAPEWIEIIKKIRENHPLVPIIVISGYDDIDRIRYSFSVWANDYIVKPVRMKELEIRIIHWIQSSYVFRRDTYDSAIYYWKLAYNIEENNFYYDGKIMNLSKNNKYILSLLFLSPEKVLSEKYLSEKIWWDIIHSGDRNLRIRILRLKKQLAPYSIDSWIKNIHSEWYILSSK